ncbi:TIGR01777 family oxidoreductase [Temperatibacter marinus]|uniref:TIGR01777 family oxidoreductase n=1 Tax=Temperatibacter marinus TaxID=1456591 RepID=A0AA52EEC3_9PROT|nr:TIGR01777 family oxidoreductase [Temperatibacter marinus]WND03226.1 TIGR01777 family oxidoreductase [Temperatibacter marinus]
MQYLLTGATGFIGTHYCHYLLEHGHAVSAVVRDLDKASKILGPKVTLYRGCDEITKTAKFDCIINLAGEPIAGGRWTKSRQKSLQASRIETTNDLINLVEGLVDKPSVMISASAVGFYGRQQDQWMIEEAEAQDIFMSSLCKFWEEAAAAVTEFGVRLVIPRLSVVLGTQGGALPALALPHRFAAGMKIGTGTQYFPWIHLDDVIDFFERAVNTAQIDGIYNLVAPDSHTQDSFNRTLADTLGRPYFLWAPAGLFKLLFGEMSDLFISGQRVSGGKLDKIGFEYSYPDLQSALSDCLLNKESAIKTIKQSAE